MTNDELLTDVGSKLMNSEMLLLALESNHAVSSDNK